MNPDKLYTISISSVIQNYSFLSNEIRNLPGNVSFDVYFQLYTEKRFCLLGAELDHLEVMSRLLRISNKRVKLLQMFQAAVEHEGHTQKNLAESYVTSCCSLARDIFAKDSAIELGLRLGGFLVECGWLPEGEKVLLACKNVCLSCESSSYFLNKLLDCCHKLLQTQSAFCSFDEAQITHRLALDTVEKLKEMGEYVNLSGLYSQFSILHFSRSEYDEAYRWSVEALQNLSPSLPVRILIDVIRQASKSCVVKREFQKAALLAKQAMTITKEVYGMHHPKTADVLIDYGFYLLNFDSIRPSVAVYEKALNIRNEIFGTRRNLHVAAAHEDLAYALYVHEYSSGRFIQAREHAEQAIDIMSNILPEKHLMLASVKRVKALILEEIALDTVSNHTRMYQYLENAESLHLSALKLSMATFGEKNVQTAKHFGNLGRLYQSMKRFQEAESMHLRAISIKEELLGLEDYEVGLSVGHLASLYNYHMKKHKKAERLYLRSIAISLKLFGDTYSGLEYDYRGLIHVYHELQDLEKVAQYTYVLNTWKLTRDMHIDQPSPLEVEETSLPIQEIVLKFML